MIESDHIRWTIAAVFWLLALVVVIFNIKRQGGENPASGAPLLCTFFTWIGVGASPLGFHALWWLVILLEIPAFLTFSSDSKED